ncbi:MAG: IS1634 family transposase [Pseudoalteromonas sp.]|nr:IS1634 family transposase [Pseudoalteromonas sp.]
MKLVETINTMVDCQMELTPGDAVLAMVMDTLRGRSPLYRLKDSMKDQDIELLIGKPIDPERFDDTNLGRGMDHISVTGPFKIFSRIGQNAVNGFEIVPAPGFHFDTTSVIVFGDYDFDDPSLNITYGHSKGKRPDLKQFMVSMLCVDRNIPILGKTEDGNASDKTLNNELLSNISTHMAKYGLGPGASIYVADSAFVTKKNLAKAKENNVLFLSRFPATFKDCNQLIEQAVLADDWKDIGILSEGSGSKKRPPAHYRYVESTVSIEDVTYRAIVIHSSAHDKRRQKRIDRMLKSDRNELEKEIKAATREPFKCRPDAEAAAARLSRIAEKSHHRFTHDISEIARYGQGRPKNGEPRIPKCFEYKVAAKIEQDPEKIQKLRTDAGCFVLITSLSNKENMEKWPAAELLRLYKDQDGIEKNFGFLKDPAIVNSIFLKKPERIEVLGLVLLLALLIWRLMERNLRLYVEKTDDLLPGWEKRMTKNPTAFMMSTKFINVLVITAGKARKLAKPLNKVQLKYLKALGVNPDVFTIP